jgi:uncharacterized repeat protein (TIGR03803 family)
MHPLECSGKEGFSKHSSRLIKIALTLALAVVLAPASQSQVFTVIHSFTGGSDGYLPLYVTIDSHGKIYGNGSNGCCGEIYRLQRSGAGWVFATVSRFLSNSTDGSPGPVTIGPDSGLYGPTALGGIFGGECQNATCGTVYSLHVPPNFCHSVSCPWNLTTLYSFGTSSNEDGWFPTGAVSFDHMGNLYGTTQTGGAGYYGQGGTVYELTPSAGTWTESILYNFVGGNDGRTPKTGVVMNQSGNLYGTTFYGGGEGCYAQGCGTVYELSPSPSGWTEKVIYSFQGGSDGDVPLGDLVLDSSGNLYGTAAYGGAGNGGTVYELTPSGEGWTFNVLYALPGTGDSGPSGVLSMDPVGNLYGTSVANGAYGYGYAFKLTRSGENWTFTDLHDFTGGVDGSGPYGGVVLDSDGNIYGAAPLGGGTPQCEAGHGCGTVWEITP